MNSVARVVEILDKWASWTFLAPGGAFLALSERRSLQGELKIRLVRKLSLFGPPQFFLSCQKSFPLSETDFWLCLSLRSIGNDARVFELKRLVRGLSWRLSTPSTDVAALRRLLTKIPSRKLSVTSWLLDGTRYRLTVKRGLRQKSFTWCRDAPAGWEVLNRITKELIRLADVQGRIDSLDWVGKGELRRELEQELRERHERGEQQKLEKLESIKRNNEICRGLAEGCQDQGLTCPGCGHRDMRYIERPASLSCFICRQCARSFRSGDFLRSK